jgi:NTE family protein
VLKALEHMGYHPAAVVGVSMGSVVGATYALRPDDWYEALLSFDTAGLPVPARSKEGRTALRDKLHDLFFQARALFDVAVGWGPGERSLEAGMDMLERLMGSMDLCDGRIPVSVCATDLISGDRVVIRSGSAVQATYASSALAGVLHPLGRGGELLADGAYSDIAPIDIAREVDGAAVIAVDPGRLGEPGPIRTGLQAALRAAEVCYTHHSHLRFALADLVLRPTFPRYIATFDFGARRTCVSAGIRLVREQRRQIQNLLGVATARENEWSLP